MDPLTIHHVIRHRLSRIETNNFQDKSGCSINGIRSFLFEEGIVEDLDDMERMIMSHNNIQDYRGYPISLYLRNFKDYFLSDEILKMKNVRFIFPYKSKPIHKLVFPEPHFVEEERNLIENHFKHVGSRYTSDDIEEWKCFQVDCEGHLVSLRSSNFQFSNESIEHLSNFPHLRSLDIFSSIIKESVTNFSHLSQLRMLSIWYGQEIQNPELFKDLGLFSKLLSLILGSNYGFGKLPIWQISFYIIYFLGDLIILPPSFSNLSNLPYLRLTRITLQGFKKIALLI